MANIKLISVAAIGAGSIFVYAGVKGFSVLKAAQNIIRGTNPGTGQTVNLLAQPGNAAPVNTAAGSASGNSIVSIAVQYVGKLKYVFGGPPPMGTVDCSSFVSMVLSQAGIQNPGGARYDPRTHGPTTLTYLGWTGATTIGHDASLAQPGDLCVWQTHMGICIGNGQMVSARDPAEGVGIDNIAGDMPGELLFVRRLI